MFFMVATKFVMNAELEGFTAFMTLSLIFFGIAVKELPNKV